MNIGEKSIYHIEQLRDSIDAIGLESRRSLRVGDLKELADRCLIVNKQLIFKRETDLPIRQFLQKVQLLQTKLDTKITTTIKQVLVSDLESIIAGIGRVALQFYSDSNNKFEEPVKGSLRYQTMHDIAILYLIERGGIDDN